MSSQSVRVEQIPETIQIANSELMMILVSHCRVP
jgi:hypothetical protein